MPNTLRKLRTIKRHNQQRACELVREKGFTWVENIYWENMKAPFKGHNPEWTCDAALRFIDEHKTKPFYLHYSTTLLHGPNGEWFRSLEKPLVTDGGMLDQPIGLMNRKSIMRRLIKAGLSQQEAGYLWMDDSLGMILDRLDRHGIAENTIVLFLAAHGSNHKGSLLKNRGTEVPCLIRWPAKIKAGVRTDELVQSTDFVPTWFDVAEVDPPSSYRTNGVSIAPLFDDAHTSVRDFVYGEMGPARSIKTKQWNYIALRYTEEQIVAIRSEHRSVKQLMGLSGGVSRASDNPHAFDSDQLYQLQRDSTELENVAGDPAFENQLTQLQGFLRTELNKMPERPFGEFIPGGNAVSDSRQKDLAPYLRRFADKK